MLSMPRIVRPDLLRSRETEIWFPRWIDNSLRSIKRNKELAKILDRFLSIVNREHQG
jgi:hypothetical protein